MFIDSAVGLALREQVVEDFEIPMGAHDWKMDVLVHPDGVVTSPE